MESFMGQICMFGFNYPPRDWNTCQGQQLSIQQHSALFALLGTQFGGDGMQSFNLPNLQGRMPMSMGTGQGLSPRVIGQVIGSESATLHENNVPPHTHTMAASNTDQGSLTQIPAAGWTLGAAASVTGARPSVVTPVSMYRAGAPGMPLQSAPSSSGTGSSAPFTVVNPALVLNFCIAINGIFPSRS